MKTLKAGKVSVRQAAAECQEQGVEAAQADAIIAVEALAKHRGNIEKLSIPQLKSIIMSKTFKQIKTGSAYNKPYYVRIVRKLLA